MNSYTPRRHGPRAFHHGRVLGVVAALVTSASAVAQAPGAANPAARVDETRSVLEQWVQLRRMISAEKRDWRLGKEVLETRSQVLQREIDDVRERIDEASANLSEADRTREELQRVQERQRASRDAIVAALTEAEGALRALLSRLPPPLRDRLSAPIAVVASDAGTAAGGAAKSVAQRMAAVVAILTECERFNREITLAHELRELDDGRSAEVRVLYLGLGQAFYVTASDDAAGVGAPTENGWAWVAANDAAGVIRKAIDVYEQTSPAAFVHLPVSVRTGATR